MIWLECNYLCEQIYLFSCCCCCCRFFFIFIVAFFALSPWWLCKRKYWAYLFQVKCMNANFHQLYEKVFSFHRFCSPKMKINFIVHICKTWYSCLTMYKFLVKCYYIFPNIAVCGRTRNWKMRIYEKQRKIRKTQKKPTKTITQK